MAPTVLGRPVDVPRPGEYVAGGAACQAAWALLGGDDPPAGAEPGVETYEAEREPEVLERYAEAAARVAAELSAPIR